MTQHLAPEECEERRAGVATRLICEAPVRRNDGVKLEMSCWCKTTPCNKILKVTKEGSKRNHWRYQQSFGVLFILDYIGQITFT